MGVNKQLTVNSLEVNCGPLSETIDSGIPKRAKTVLSSQIVAVAVVEFILICVTMAWWATAMNTKEQLEGMLGSVDILGFL